MKNKEEVNKNVFFLTSREFEWGSMYSIIAKSYPNKRKYYMPIRFIKSVEPPKEKKIKKIKIINFYLGAYEERKTGNIKPIIFVSEYEDLTNYKEVEEEINYLPYEEFEY